MTFRTELQTDQSLDYALFNEEDALSRYRIPLQCVYPLEELVNTAFMPAYTPDMRFTLWDAEGTGRYTAGMLLYETSGMFRTEFIYR